MKPFLEPGTWYDYEQAACALVIALGLYESPDTTFGPAKWVFHSDNPIGRAIDLFLLGLATHGVIEQNEDKFRVPVEYDPKAFGDKCPDSAE